MVLFKKDNMDADKPVFVVNVPHVRFIVSLTRKVITVLIQESWYPEILVALITMVGVPVEDYLAGIGIKSRKVVICIECGDESSWVRSLGEL